jgi:hypothetical protein
VNQALISLSAPAVIFDYDIHRGSCFPYYILDQRYIIILSLDMRRQPHPVPRPPYIDPDNQIVYDVNDADLEGFLTKQSMWLKDWRRRYFILKGSRVFFSKNEFTAPHGMIDLSKVS